MTEITPQIGEQPPGYQYYGESGPSLYRCWYKKDLYFHEIIHLCSFTMIIDLLAYILFFHHEQIAIPFIATTIITLFLGDGQGYHLITQNGPSFTSSEITFRNTFWNKKFWMTVLIAMTAMMNRVIWTVCLAAVMNRDEPNNISQGEEKALGLGEL